MLAQVFLGDCLIESDKIESGSVDLILTDLPYGTVKNIAQTEGIEHGMKGKLNWDDIIDTVKIFEIANRILRKNGKMILFSQEPFSFELIKSIFTNSWILLSFDNVSNISSTIALICSYSIFIESISAPVNFCNLISKIAFACTSTILK